MSEPISLKQVERKAFRLNFEDGLIDIQIGMVMLLLGAADRLGEVGFGIWGMLAAVVLAIAFQGLLALVKRAFILPRVGRIKFSPHRRRRVWTLHWIVLATVILSFALVMGVRFIARSNANLASSRTAIWVIVIFFAVVVLAIFAGMTYFLDEPRLLLHGVMIFFAVPAYFALQEYTEITSSLPYLVVGSIALVIGLTLLLRFLRKYPKPPAAPPILEVPNGSR